MVPAGFTLAEHNCHGMVPLAVLCQPQRVFSYTPPAVHNLPPHIVKPPNITQHNLITPKQPKHLQIIIVVMFYKPTK